MLSSSFISLSPRSVYLVAVLSSFSDLASFPVVFHPSLIALLTIHAPQSVAPAPCLALCPCLLSSSLSLSSPSVSHPVYSLSFLPLLRLLISSIGLLCLLHCIASHPSEEECQSLSINAWRLSCYICGSQSTKTKSKFNRGAMP